MDNKKKGSICSKAEFAKIANDPKLNELQKLERALKTDLYLLPGGEPSYKTLKIIDGFAAILKEKIGSIK